MRKKIDNKVMKLESISISSAKRIQMVAGGAADPELKKLADDTLHDLVYSKNTALSFPGSYLLKEYR